MKQNKEKIEDLHSAPFIPASVHKKMKHEKQFGEWTKEELEEYIDVQDPYEAAKGEVLKGK